MNRLKKIASHPHAAVSAVDAFAPVCRFVNQFVSACSLRFNRLLSLISLILIG